MSLLLNLGIVAVITVGAVRVNNGTSEIGKIIAFMNLYTIVLNALMAINRIFMMLFTRIGFLCACIGSAGHAGGAFRD